LKYGTDPNHLDQTEQTKWGELTHRVEIKNLQPNTQYYYQVFAAQGLNSPGQREQSKVDSFRTAAPGQQVKTNYKK
jgi:phosphodiesterase/alkaline phosphatase D-like protein